MIVIRHTFIWFLVTFTAINVNCQVFLIDDIQSGAKYLSTDPIDGYYDVVNPIEIAIQLKDTSLDFSKRQELVDLYKSSYLSEVISPTISERETASSILMDAIKKVNELNTNLLPDSIRLIFVKGDHYGPTTFFTRKKSIVTSSASMANMEELNFQRVMYHELFHIISRYNPELRKTLYHTIGFNKLEDPLIIPNSFKKQILYNPDGVTLDYAISLMSLDSNTRLYIPIIYTTAHNYSPENRAFFGYLKFDLLPLVETENGYTLGLPDAITQESKGSTMQQYFRKITMNTQYIIHPDEILADNFMYLFRSEEENAQLDKNLLNEIHSILKNHK